MALFRVCDASLEDASIETVSQHFQSAHPAENFASLEDIPESRVESDKPAEGKKDLAKKKETVAGRKRERTPDLNQNSGKKAVSSESICILVNETSTDDEDAEDGKYEKLEASSAKRPRVEFSREGSAISAEQRRYAGALIPLPYLEFPRGARLFSCTVCPAPATFTSLGQFEEHRESDQHRGQYGEKFRRNNCQHFPDGAHFNARGDLACCYCSAKVGDGSLSSAVLTSFFSSPPDPPG